MRLRCNLPDTLVLRDGQPYVWFATNKVCICAWEPVAIWRRHRQSLTASHPTAA